MSLKKLGRYDIIKPLGKGAMGLVYEAHDPNINRTVAIKTIRVDQLSEDMAAEYESRFRSETQAGGRLQHPNIIGVYDAGRDQGLAFMVMELVRGGDLRQQLDQGRRLTFDRSMSIMKELLSALSFAHDQGIIHRDIKPANVMLDPNGRVKLGDFGVARITDVGEATRTQGSMVGTLKYMSPEQVIGAKVDARTDLFAAGVVLYQLVTGTKPFEGDSDFAIMQAIAQQDPPRPSTLNLSLPAGVDAVVFKALAKNRDNRYASAKDFALALRAVTQQAAAGIHALPPPAPAPPALAPTPPPYRPEAGAGDTSTGTGGGRSGSGGTNTSPSAVSQEMELLYWKDIQDSADPEDFQGFLQQFPIGVYAGLAQRRLRKLASPTSERTGSQSVAGPSVSSMQARLKEAVVPAPALVPASTKPAAPAPTDIDFGSEAFEATRVAPASAPSAETSAADRAAREATARRGAEDAARRQVEEARHKAEDVRRAEQARVEAEARKLEADRLARGARQAEEAGVRAKKAAAAEDARKADQERKAREAQAAEAKRGAEEARLSKLAEQAAVEAEKRVERRTAEQAEREAVLARNAELARRADQQRAEVEARKAEQRRIADAALKAQQAIQAKEAEAAERDRKVAKDAAQATAKAAEKLRQAEEHEARERADEARLGEALRLLEAQRAEADQRTRQSIHDPQMRDSEAAREKAARAEQAEAARKVKVAEAAEKSRLAQLAQEVEKARLAEERKRAAAAIEAEESRLALQKAEAQKVEALNAEAQRAKALEAEVTRVEAERAEAERVEEERVELNQAAAKRAEAAAHAGAARQGEEARRAQVLRVAEEARKDDSAKALRRAQSTRADDDRKAEQAQRAAELRWIGAARASQPQDEPHVTLAPTTAGTTADAATNRIVPTAPLASTSGAAETQAPGIATPEATAIRTADEAALLAPAPAPAPARASPIVSVPAPAPAALPAGAPTVPALPTAAPPAGNGRLIAIAAAIAVLGGGGAWLALRDKGPEAETAPTPRPTLPEPPAATAPAPPLAEPPARPQTELITPVPAAPEPAASMAVPADAGLPMAQAKALERSDLRAAIAAYEKVVNGAERKDAAEAARRLWELYRDGGKGVANNPEQAQRWYDRARKMGLKLPAWTAERPGQPPAPAPAAIIPTAPVPVPAAIPQAAPPAPVPSPAPAPAPAPIAPAPVREPPLPIPQPAPAPAPPPAPAAKATPAELFERGQKLEGTSLRQAESAYREAADQGHGPSQKRMWELLLKSGRDREAVSWQRKAWEQKVPGVPEPIAPIRF